MTVIEKRYITHTINYSTLLNLILFIFKIYTLLIPGDSRCGCSHNIFKYLLNHPQLQEITYIIYIYLLD